MTDRKAKKEHVQLQENNIFSTRSVGEQTEDDPTLKITRSLYTSVSRCIAAAALLHLSKYRN